jgi:hypothetical protein
VVVHPERLQHPGIRQEGARALAIEGAQLVHILQDGPELQPVSGHQPHGALDGFEPAQGGELIEQKDGPRRFDCRAGHVGQCLSDQQAQPARIGIETIGGRQRNTVETPLSTLQR